VEKLNVLNWLLFEVLICCCTSCAIRLVVTRKSNVLINFSAETMDEVFVVAGLMIAMMFCSFSGMFWS